MTVSAHTITAVADIPVNTTEALAEQLALNPLSARVILDEGWSPCIQANLETSIPPAATFAALDPRANIRVRLYLRQNFGTSETAATLTAAFAGTPVEVLPYPDTFYPDTLYPA